MFKKPFSFDGRIARVEYLISFIIFAALGFLISIPATGSNDIIANASIVLLIPVAWFRYAQGAKRCHDTGRSGWWKLIQFFWTILIIAKGDVRGNRFGDISSGIY